MALENTDLLPLWRTTDSTNRKISVLDFKTYVSSGTDPLEKPGREGIFLVVEDADGNISYLEYESPAKPDREGIFLVVEDANGNISYLEYEPPAKPGEEGTFLVVEDAAGNISFTKYEPITEIDGGLYAS